MGVIEWEDRRRDKTGHGLKGYSREAIVSVAMVGSDCHVKEKNMGRMSREKGARGERSVAALFREYGYDASRTAQHSGKTGQAPDIIGIPLIHCEIKYQEKMHLYDWMAQAVRDSDAEGKGNLPTVFHKQNHKDLLVTMRFEDWMKLYTEWEAGQLPFNERESDDG